MFALFKNVIYLRDTGSNMVIKSKTPVARSLPSYKSRPSPHKLLALPPKQNKTQMASLVQNYYLPDRQHRVSVTDPNSQSNSDNISIVTMIQATLYRERKHPDLITGKPKQELKFGDVTVYLVERKMGKTRRNFLTCLARSKGFCVDSDLRYVQENNFIINVVDEKACSLSL